MKQPHRRAIVPAGLLLATLAVGPARATAPALATDVGATSELVRLVSPPAGATLWAGSSLGINWEPGSALAGFPEAEEWELFVSLDGGRTYLSRLTPHLDLAVRRITVRVPELASSDVRLLVRVGDERHEREQLLAGGYRISAPAVARPTWRRRLPARGEPLRLGAPGVLVWVDGNRDGTGWVEREAHPAPGLSSPGLTAGRRAQHGLGPRPRPGAKLLRAPLASAGYADRAVPAASPTVAASPPAPRLARLCRRNE